MRILVYIEPHPIRNSHEQYTFVGRLFGPALLKAQAWSDVEFRIFANESVASRLSAELPELSPLMLRPNAAETDAIRALDRTWDAAAIAQWMDLVHGRGTVTSTYVDLFKRLRREFPFDVILLWSENGAAKQAAQLLSAVSVHCELGPTRPPFPPTMYLDVRGANGNASVRAIPKKYVESARVVPREAWLASTARRTTSARGVMESGVLWPSPTVSPLLPKSRYVFIPLQLADDLNTLCHSDVESPTAFLERVIPQYQAAGFEVVLKGHPGVFDRPSNVVAQTRAFRRFRDVPGVTVLPLHASATDTLAVVAQAQAVCSINSSLGFESMLLGKPCTLLGDAAYDLYGDIRKRGFRYELSEGERGEDTRRISFLMGHYFVPLEDIESGEALLAALEVILREQRQGGEFGDSFWARWVEVMDFGWRDLLQAEASPLAPSRKFKAIADGVACVLDGELTEADANIDVQLVVPGELVRFRVHRASGLFAGHIDGVTREAGAIRVAGWAFSLGQQSAPIFLLVVEGARVLLSARPTQPRVDVAASLKTPSAAHCGFDFELYTDSDPASLRLLLVSEGRAVQELPLRAGLFG